MKYLHTMIRVKDIDESLKFLMGSKGRNFPSAMGAKPTSGVSHIPSAIIVCFILDDISVM